MKANLKNLLVPFDFNEASELALRNACSIAKRIDGKIHLLFVIIKQDFISELLGKNDDLVALTQKVKQQLMERAKKATDEYGIEIETVVRKGKVYEEILKMGREIEARFIVLGDNHSKDKEMKVLGSNATRIVSRATCPVLTVKNEPSDFKKILVSLDLGTETRKQLFATIAFGLHWKADIDLVSVVMGGISIKNSRIYRKMKRVKKTLIENHVHATTSIYKRSNEPAYKRVLEHAAESGADVILIMTHEEKRSDNYIGAFAHNIINQSTIPVISLTSVSADTDTDIVMKDIIDPFRIIFRNDK